jgi:heat shock protein HslJ
VQRLAGMTRRSPVPAAIGLALALLLGACRGAGIGQTPSLDGSWILQSGTHAGAAIPLVAGSDVSLVIDGGKVSGRACNLYSGTIAISGDRVTLGEMAMTEMACDEPVMAAEAAYHAALAAIDTARRSGDTLTLTGPGVTLRYRLQPPVAGTPLIATRWVLEALIDGEVASSPLGQPATLTLAPDGTATGSTGCRAFSASYTLSSDRLALTGFSVEQRLCTRDLAGQDQQVVAVLSGGVSITVSGANLTLIADDGQGLAYRAAPGSTGPGGGTSGPAGSGMPQATPPDAGPDPIDRVLPSGKAFPLEPLSSSLPTLP